MKKADWIWMPHAGHFICDTDCRFRLNTYVGGFIVSTVGEYWPDSQVRKIHADVAKVTISGIGDEWDANYFKKFGFTEIGCDRTYETMVFRAKKDDSTCCPWRMVNGEDLDFAGYNNAAEATAGHMELCKKWARKK